MTNNSEIIKTKKAEIALLKDLKKVFDKHGNTCNPEITAYTTLPMVGIELKIQPHPKEEGVEFKPEISEMIKVREDLIKELE